MNIGRTIFAPLLDLLPRAAFRRCVDGYRGDYQVQSFSGLDPFLALAFPQLPNRESRRDLETCLRAPPRQLYHRGLRGGLSRNNTIAQLYRARASRIVLALAQQAAEKLFGSRS
jgi:hypothetical protein